MPSLSSTSSIRAATVQFVSAVSRNPDTEAAARDLVDEVRAGTDYRDIHLSTHRHVARILLEQGIARGVSEEALLADRKSTRLNSSHVSESRMPSSA